MPIRPEKKHLYPPNWLEISLSVRAAAGFRCEGSPVYPECRAIVGVLALMLAAINRRGER